MATSERRPHYRYQDERLRAMYVKRFGELDPQLGKGIGEGWQPIVGQAACALDLVADGWVPVQIKEKFGTLRFYLELPDGLEPGYKLAAEAVVDWAERASTSVCEWCGDWGDLRNTDHWLLTLCDYCQHSRQRGWRPWHDQEREET